VPLFKLKGDAVLYSGKRVGYIRVSNGVLHLHSDCGRMLSKWRVQGVDSLLEHERDAMLRVALLKLLEHNPELLELY